MFSCLTSSVLLEFVFGECPAKKSEKNKENVMRKMSTAYLINNKKIYEKFIQKQKTE